MILVTGASGFIGGRLLRALSADGRLVRALARQVLHVPGVECIQGDLSDSLALRLACTDVKTIFHCAGYAHAFKAQSANESELHWQINYEGTKQLLEVAAAAGVKTFVFLSSVKAMADPGESCVGEDWPGEPDSDYGCAKRAAERAVLEVGQRFGMQVTNLRLTMVYGAGGHGNLERMAHWVERAWFPPLPETGNHRSMVHIDDVLTIMRIVANDPRSDGKTYIVAGPESPSGKQLLAALRLVLGFPELKYSISEGLLRFLARCGDLLGRALGCRLPFDSEVCHRLLGSAWYSPESIARDLGWRARIGLHQGLREMLGK